MRKTCAEKTCKSRNRKFTDKIRKEVFIEFYQLSSKESIWCGLLLLVNQTRRLPAELIHVEFKHISSICLSKVLNN